MGMLRLMVDGQSAVIPDLLHALDLDHLHGEVVVGAALLGQIDQAAAGLGGRIVQ